MRRVALATAAAFALALAGCGGTTPASEESAGEESAPSQQAKKGGDLTVLYAADVDKIDPGVTYYQYGFLVAYATQRPLYGLFKPDDAINPEPGPCRGPAGDLRGRQDGHREDPAGARSARRWTAR